MQVVRNSGPAHLFSFAYVNLGISMRWLHFFFFFFFGFKEQSFISKWKIVDIFMNKDNYTLM